MKLYILSDLKGFVDYQIYGVYDSEEKAKEVMRLEWEGDEEKHKWYNNFEEWFDYNYEITTRELNKIYFYGEEVEE